jgi:hypothetical protein
MPSMSGWALPGPSSGPAVRPKHPGFYALDVGLGFAGPEEQRASALPERFYALDVGLGFAGDAFPGQP